jgi:branched-subunit amino acid transport protein AzlD
MTLTAGQTLIIIAVVALATQVTRILPFVLFPDNKETHPFMVYLGKVLPHAAIGLLVVYCLKNISIAATPHGLPEILAILAIAALHIWKKNVLLSIGAGTVLYMVLVQVVFI